MHGTVAKPDNYYTLNKLTLKQPSPVGRSVVDANMKKDLRSSHFKVGEGYTPYDEWKGKTPITEPAPEVK